MDPSWAWVKYVKCLHHHRNQIGAHQGIIVTVKGLFGGRIPLHSYGKINWM